MKVRSLQLGVPKRSQGLGQGALELPGLAKEAKGPRDCMQEVGQRVGEVAPGPGTSVRLGADGSWLPGIQDAAGGLAGDRRPCGGADHGCPVLLNRDARTATTLVWGATALAQDPARTQTLPTVSLCLWGASAKHKFPLEPGCLCPGSASGDPLGEGSLSGPHLAPSLLAGSISSPLFC